MSLQGKVAVVTGAARGLGRAYALRLASLGADVAILDINLDGARDYNEALGAGTVAEEIIAMARRSVGVQADLGKREEAERALKEVAETLGPIDIMVNNAGGMITAMDRSLASICPDEDTDLLFTANFKSTIYCCQTVIPGMRDRGSGIIVNIGSQSGVSAYPGGYMATYGASKAAVLQYTRSLASEVGPFGIRVNCISPGIIMTSRVAANSATRSVGTSEQAAAIPLRRLGTPEDCCGALEFLTTDLSRYVTGQCVCVDGGVVLTPS